MAMKWIHCILLLFALDAFLIGQSSYVDQSAIAGINNVGFNRGVAVVDYNNDGWEDLYFTRLDKSNILYRNDGDGTFTNVSDASGIDIVGDSGAAVWGDLDNDGWADLVLGNRDIPSQVFRNNGDGTFSDITEAAGVDNTAKVQSVLLADVDNDGWLDIYVANDSEFSPYPNVLYRNQGNNFFLPVELEEAVSSMGQSYAAICFDFQQDGMMDLAVANRGVGDHFQLFQNADRPGNWIGIKLLGKESNSSAIGSKVHIVDEQGLISYKELTAGQGWAGQNSNVLYFGLGQAATLDSVTVFWPSGLVQPLSQLKLNRYYTVEEGASPREGIIGKPLLTSSPLLQNENRNLVLDVFPNPSTGKVVLHTNLTKPTPLQLNVFNVLGKLLYTQYIEPKLAQNQTWELNFLRLIQEKHLILQLKTPDEVVSKRLILQP